MKAITLNTCWVIVVIAIAIHRQWFWRTVWGDTDRSNKWTRSKENFRTTCWLTQRKKPFEKMSCRREVRVSTFTKFGFRSLKQASIETRVCLLILRVCFSCLSGQGRQPSSFLLKDFIPPQHLCHVCPGGIQITSKHPASLQNLPSFSLPQCRADYMEMCP